MRKVSIRISAGFWLVSAWWGNFRKRLFLPKEGSHFDLPIALGLLVAMGTLPEDEIAGYCALGELALDGRISPVAGVLPAAVHALASERGLICPAAQGGEAAWADGIEILAADSLLALVNHFKGTEVFCDPRELSRDVMKQAFA